MQTLSQMGEHRRPHLVHTVLIPVFLLLWMPWGRAQEAPTGAVIVVDRAIFTLQAPVGSIEPSERAAIVNRRLERILSDPALPPEQIGVLSTPDGNPLIALGPFPILSVTAGDAAAQQTTREELAQRWARRLRETLVDIKPLYRPEREKPVSFMPLVLVSLLAFAAPLFASQLKRVRVPIVVGEILLGMLIGRSGLNLLHYNTWLQFLGEFGFAYLMFLSGLEVDFSLLKQRPDAERTWKQNPAIIGALALGLTLTVSFAICFALAKSHLILYPLMMTLVLSTTSLGLVVPTLKERGLTVTPYGQALLLCALIADFVTMFLITIVAGWIASGPTLKLLFSLFLAVAFLGALRAGQQLRRLGWLRRLFEELAHATAQIQVRGSLALMLIFVALSEQLGTEVILGAFLAGALISLLSGREESELKPKLEALGFGFFIPIFFILIGAKFELKALLGSPQTMLLALLLIVCAFLLKIASALPLRWVASWRETLAGGFLLSSRLSLIIAAGEIGVRLGLFTKNTHTAIICVALVTCIGGPMGFQALLPGGRSARRRQALIVGAGEHGLLLAARLKNQGWRVTLLELAPTAAKEVRTAGAELLTGDGRDPEALREAGIAEASVVIAATSSDTVNATVCAEAERAGIARRIALVRAADQADRLRQLGVAVVTPTLSLVTVLEGLVLHPAVFQTLTGADPEKRIADLVVPLSRLAGRPLRDIPWPGDTLVLALQRNGDILIPNGTTLLRAGDVLTLVGSAEYIEEAQSWSQG